MARLMLIVALALGLGAALPPAPAHSAQLPVASVTVLIPERGGRVEWSPVDADLIAFDMWADDTFHDIYTMHADGSGTLCITCGRPDIPQRENGNPAWHPSGQYIVFQSEEPEHYLEENRWAAYPGVGCFANLWAYSFAEDRFFKLTFHPPYTWTDYLAAHPVTAVLHPHFNSDGSKLLWTERYGDHPDSAWGKWKVVMADFSLDGGPHLENVADVFVPEPPGGWFAESMGFRPGHDDEIAVVGNLEPGQHEYGMDIYRYNVTTHELVNLTRSQDIWDEDTSYTNDGERMLFMSHMGWGPADPSQDWTTQPRTGEYYLMDADDGSALEQVTHFNEPGWPEYAGGVQMGVADSSFSPDGFRLASLLVVDSDPDPDVFQANLVIAVIHFAVSSPDSDGDGCTDAQELGPGPALGGTRDPNNPHDFYDVPVPTAFNGGTLDDRDRAVTIARDLLAVLEYAGTSDGGPPNLGPDGLLATPDDRDYDQDNNGDTLDDGLLYDRSPGANWSGAPDGAITVIDDVLLVLAQSGHACQAPP